MPETQTIPEPYRSLLQAAEDEFVRAGGKAIDTARNYRHTGKVRYRNALIRLFTAAYRIGQQYARDSVPEAVARARGKYPDTQIDGRVYKPSVPEALIKRRANNVVKAQFTKLKTDIEFDKIAVAFGRIDNIEPRIKFHFDALKAWIKSNVAPTEGQEAFVLGERSVFGTFRG